MFSFKKLKKTPPIIILISVCLLALLLQKLYKKYQEMPDADLKIPKKEMKSDILSKKEESLEKFAPPKRYMYQSSGIKRNSSWDIRGEDSLIKFEPEKTGSFNASALKNNYTNKK
jgi:hypothetical protein